MKPKLILAMIAGGMTGVFINVLFDAGLRAPAAPGSVFAVYAQTPGGSYRRRHPVDHRRGGRLLPRGRAAAQDRRRPSTEGELVGATARMEAMKGKSLDRVGRARRRRSGTAPIRNIVFACDAGMGSSAMGASVLRKKVHGAGFTDVTVVNKAIANLTDDFDLVVSHQDLTDRASRRPRRPCTCRSTNFMGSPAYDEIVELIRHERRRRRRLPRSRRRPTWAASSLPSSRIVLDAAASHRDAAITRAGELLVAAEAVDSSYVASMHAREQSVSTFMGNLLALPHGTNEAKASIRRTAVSFVRYADPVDWNGKQVRFVIGVAAVGDDHLKLLRRIAEIFVDKEQVARLGAATSPDEVAAILGAAQPA